MDEGEGSRGLREGETGCNVKSGVESGGPLGGGFYNIKYIFLFLVFRTKLTPNF